MVERLAPFIRVPPPGPRSRELTARLDAVECPSFFTRRRVRAETTAEDMGGIVLASGEGSIVEDVDGNRYVDLAAGFGSLVLGHGAPEVRAAIAAQSARLVQGLGDVFASDVKIALLERLARIRTGGGDRAILCQSGADAVTAAIKTSALATGRPGLVAFEGCYHGLGYAPLAACGLRESYRAPFGEQLNAHVAFAPYPRRDEDVDRCLEAVRRGLVRARAGAVLVEPILGRGGCVVPPPGFLDSLRAVAHEAGALLVADEIWTGMGRSGALLRTRAIGVEADIVCLGKGLGGGLPIAACIAPARIMDAWARDEEVIHTSTHAGWPLACAAAIATLETIERSEMTEGETLDRGGLAARAAALGERAIERLRARASGASGARGIVDVRGEGLLLGVELADGVAGIRAVRALLRKGFLAVGGGTRGEVITITPALTIDERQLDLAVDAVAEVASA